VTGDKVKGDKVSGHQKSDDGFFFAKIFIPFKKTKARTPTEWASDQFLRVSFPHQSTKVFQRKSGEGHFWRTVASTAVGGEMGWNGMHHCLLPRKWKPNRPGRPKRHLREEKNHFSSAAAYSGLLFAEWAAPNDFIPPF
jgi:hypothetical protein